jgi:hypothetical protein
MQGYVVLAIIGTMASSDFSRHIALDFPFRVILPLLLNHCHFPGLGPGDGVRPPQFLQILCRHSTTPTPGKGGHALPVSSGRLLPSPHGLGLGLSTFPLTTQQYSLYAADCRLALSFRDLRTATGLESLPAPGICYMAFRSLPWRDFHPQAPAGLSGHTGGARPFRFLLDHRRWLLETQGVSRK